MLRNLSTLRTIRGVMDTGYAPKYAVLLLATWTCGDADTAQRQLAPDIFTWQGTLSEAIEDGEVQHWKDWLGEIEWAAFMERSRFVLASQASKAPSVSDAESIVLRNGAMLGWHAMLLTAPKQAFHGVARFASGQAVTVTQPVRLLSMKQNGRVGEVQRPFYDTRPAFGQGQFGQADDQWLDRWCRWVAILDPAFTAGLPPILDVALYAFRMALSRTRLEFRIPEFVRTAECILAVPRHGGGPVFTQRALRIAPGLAGHWYVGGSDLEQRIRALYQHRSDCVHGKVPFIELVAKGDAGKDEAARLEYLAEALAREALQLAFHSQQHFRLLEDRALLEQAWASGQFP